MTETQKAQFVDNGILGKCEKCAGAGQNPEGVECPECQGFGEVRNRRKWRLEFTIGAARRLASSENFDVFDEKMLPKLFRPDETELQVNAIWVCIEDQANLRGIDEDEFARRLGGDSILEAHEALMEALKVFFTARGVAPLAKCIERQKAIMDRAMEKAEEKLDGLDLTDAEIDAHLEKAMESLRSPYGPKSGELQAQ